MPYTYSDPTREADTYALPNIEVFQLTAEEVLELGDYDDEIHEARARFRLASFNSRDRGRLVAYLVESLGITGGWFWQACFPGCLPDGPPDGPYATYADAVAAAQECAE